MDYNIISKKKYFLFGIIAVLVFGNFYFIFKSNSLSVELSEREAQTEISVRNEKVIEFLDLFVEKVLKSDQEIDFDTRLSLENSVRATKDEDLIKQWQKFTNSKTENLAQVEVVNLLSIIVNKIK